MLHIGDNRAIHMSKRFAQPCHKKQNMFLPGLVPKACQNHPPTSARHRSGKISFLRDHNVPNAGNMALGKSETLKQIILSWAASGSQTFSSGCLPGPFIAISFTNFSLGTFCMGTAPLESSQGMCCLLLFHLVICFLRMRGTCCNGTSCSMTSWTQRVWNCVSEKWSGKCCVWETYVCDRWESWNPMFAFQTSLLWATQKPCSRYIHWFWWSILVLDISLYPDQRMPRKNQKEQEKEINNTHAHTQRNKSRIIVFGLVAKSLLFRLVLLFFLGS